MQERNQLRIVLKHVLVELPEMLMQFSRSLDLCCHLG
jgi:hypothetical protein